MVRLKTSDEFAEWFLGNDCVQGHRFADTSIETVLLSVKLIDAVLLSIQNAWCESTKLKEKKY